MYVDESGINKFLHKESGYAKKGEKIFAKISGNRFTRENFIAAKIGSKIVAPGCYKGSCDTDLFNFWLENFLAPQLTPGQTIIMDNASFHKSEKTRKIIENAKCKLLFLPPYSPELNPIEKFWANFKQKITQSFENYTNLHDAICAIFQFVCQLE